MTVSSTRRSAAPVASSQAKAPTRATPRGQAAALHRALMRAEHPGHMATAAQDAMKFLMSADSKSLTVTQSRKLHVALGETLASLAEASWSPRVSDRTAKKLIAQLDSQHPGENANGVVATMEFLRSPAAARLDSTSRNNLFMALGEAQLALGEIAP